MVEELENKDGKLSSWYFRRRGDNRPWKADIVTNYHVR